MNKLNWQTIALNLSGYDEPTLERMLADEINKHKRTAIARRLHQRLCKLRSLRERKELMKRMGV